MKTLKSILLLVLIYSACSGYAQDHSGMMVTWKAVQTTNPDNSVVTENTSLVLHGRENLEWKKTTGQIIKSFDVSEIVGTWPLNGDNSEMRFEVVETGKGGYITISKSGNALTAVIVIDYDHPAQYKLILQN